MIYANMLNFCNYVRKSGKTGGSDEIVKSFAKKLKKCLHF